MAIADTKGTARGLSKAAGQVVTVTGLSNSTDYDVETTFPSGRIQKLRVTSNGSGTLVLPSVPAYEDGTYTLVVNSIAAQVYTTSWKA